MKAAIRRVDLASLGKFGCLLGMLAAFLPSLLCGLLGLGLVQMVHRWLESWQEMTISVLGAEIARFDLVHILGLDKLLESSQVLATASVPVLVLAVMGMALVSGTLLAGTIALVGLGYNLLAAATGGLVVEMTSVDQQETIDRE